MSGSGLVRKAGPSAMVLALVLLAGCGGGGHSSGDTDPGLAPPTASVSGTVKWQGNPLSGATVTAYNTNTNAVIGTVLTDANGNYTFTGLLASGDVPPDDQFWVRMPGYGFYPSAGAGGTVSRMGYSGMFQGNGVTDVAISFTVIDYSGLAGTAHGNADFNAFNAQNAPVNLARTGQTSSFAPGDDGSLQAGAALPGARFKNNGNGTITDNLTGLIWLGNAGYFGPTTWAGALAEVDLLADGTAGLKDGSKAGDWRVPNLVELESLVDVSASNPALTSGSPFSNVANDWYWSSTFYWGGSSGSSSAWIINFGDGSYINDSKTNAMTASHGVWAVKGLSSGPVKLQATGQYDGMFGDGAGTPGDDGSLQMGVPLNYPRWIDNGNGTVIDSVTGLTWLKKADAFHLSWTDALAAIGTLQDGQFGLSDHSRAGDWRMPNRKEVQSMADRFMNNHADFFNATFTPWNTHAVYQEPIFTNFEGFNYYWTSSTDAADPTQAWSVFSCDFGVYPWVKTDVSYSLAVR